MRRASTVGNSEPTTSPAALIGRRIAGKMEVLEHLGGGGMGWVFSAYHHALGKRVAIKVLKRLGDPLHAKRFEVEAMSASRLEHPNAVTILDFGEDGPDRLVYLAMEFLEGRDLDRIIRSEAPMDPRRSVQLMTQVLAALTSAHEVGVIHRDLKPANVMVHERPDDDGARVERVKVCDFGLAKILDPEAPSQGLTRRGMIVGTPDYMSPEQAVGDAVDGRTDVYACGVILYEMLCGVRPFVAEDPGDVLLMHLNDVPTPPRQRVPSIPRELERVVLWALEKRPDRRASSARELRDALKRLMDRPDPFDLETVVDVSELRRALERTSAPAPESITDQLEVVRGEPATSSGAIVHRGEVARDTLIDETPAVDAEIARAETDERVLAPDTWRGLESTASDASAPPAAFGYDGPWPFWVLHDGPRRVGPCSYGALDAVLEGLPPDLAETAGVSADGEQWRSLSRYYEITGQAARGPGGVPPLAHDGPPRGDLTKVSPIALLAQVAFSGATGRLVITEPHRRTELFVREGQPIEVRGSAPEDQLPALLVSRGLVPQDSLPGLVHAAVEADTPLEQVLASAVDLPLLRTALMKERLRDLVPLTQGTFGFDADAAPPLGPPFAPSLLGLLPNLVFRALSAEALEARIGAWMQTALRPTKHAAALLELLHVSEADAALLSRFSAGASPAEVLEATGSGRNGALALLYLYLHVGALRPDAP